MKTCYLHIGHAKTATSSLQAFMHKNDDLLADTGIWVPSDYRQFKSFDCKAIAESGRNFAGNFGPIFYAKIKSDKALADALLDHVFSRDMDVLLSSELVFYYKYFLREIMRFANSRGFAVTLIAYLRRQDRMVVPAFYQNIRNHGYFKDLSSFLDETADVRYFRFAEVINSYAVSEPNRIIVRTFEPDYLIGRDIIEDFVTCLGLDIPVSAIKRPDRYANPGLPLESLEVIRGLNVLGRPDLVRKVINQSTAKLQPEERGRVRDYYYTPDIAATVAERFLSTNGELVETYFWDHSEAERAYWIAAADLPKGFTQLSAEKLASTLLSIVSAPG